MLSILLILLKLIGGSCFMIFLNFLAMWLVIFFIFMCLLMYCSIILAAIVFIQGIIIDRSFNLVNTSDMKEGLEDYLDLLCIFSEYDYDKSIAILLNIGDRSIPFVEYLSDSYIIGIVIILQLILMIVTYRTLLYISLINEMKEKNVKSIKNYHYDDIDAMMIIRIIIISIIVIIAMIYYLIILFI